MPTPRDLSAILSHITAERAKALMVALSRAPSPLTELMEAEAAAARIHRYRSRAAAARHGDHRYRTRSDGQSRCELRRRDSGRSLMLVTNAMNQPASTMPNPYGGEVRDGAPYACPARSCLAKA